MRTAFPSLANGYARSSSESAYPGLWNGLVCAHIPLLGHQGFTLLDFSGYCRGATMTNMNNDSWTVHKDGVALNFDGTDDYVLGSYSEAIGSDQVSYVVRFKTATTSNLRAGLLCQRNASTFQQFDIGITGDTGFGTAGTKIIIVEGNSLGNRLVLSNAAVTDALWHHCVAVRGSSTNTLWIDGIMDSTTGSSSLGTIASVPLMIGQLGNSGAPVAGYYFAGLISEALVYNRPLSPGEIELLNQVPAAPFVLRPRRYTGQSGQDLTLSVSDSITMSETRTGGFGANKSDAITIADAKTSAVAAAKTDSFTLADSESASFGSNKSDAISMADARAMAIAKVLAESGLNFSDATVIGLLREFSDALTVGDVDMAAVAKLFADAINLADSATSGGSSVLSDPFTISDASLFGVAKILSDSLSLSDSISSFLATILSFSDGLTIGDAINLLLLIGKITPGGTASFVDGTERGADYVERSHQAQLTAATRAKASGVSPAHLSTFQKPTRKLVKY